LDTVWKYYIILEATFHSHEETASDGTHLRAETQPERRVLHTFQTLLIGNTTVPVIVIEEGLAANLAAYRILLPTVTDLPVELQRIRIGQLALIAQRGIERTIEKEAAVQGEILIPLPCKSRSH
jgi:hypothetical protein